MREGLQNTTIKNLYETGCYFLCICKIAEEITSKNVDIINTALYAQDKAWVDEDFTVNNPEALLSYLTGKKVKVTKSETLPNGTKYYVEKWYNPKTGYCHFRLPKWDSLKDSVTVKNGSIESYRLLDIK